jgi:hypothetical protein
MGNYARQNGTGFAGILWVYFCTSVPVTSAT